ncbi:MAG: hypothetical protein EZS28_018208 [Streblomastix strix]|uniref:Uncharacterized protein n=1 Tax=Streblomastix strix TaxID=222440 RepID=A0A5J4VUC7_9EUKA|nr:MAG: hypothetical protein EZS28_018208 [Streblomastix strix]
MISDKKICPLRWFKSWFTDRKPNIPNKVKELRKISRLEKNIQADDLSKAIRAVMQSARISKTYSVTSIRAAAITILQKHNFISVQVDRFTHQSDITPTVTQFYDKNINFETTEVLGKTEEELNNEEYEEHEKTLLEVIEHERFKVEQRIPSPIGVLCPGLQLNQQTIEELTISVGGSLQPGGILTVLRKKYEHLIYPHHIMMFPLLEIWGKRRALKSKQ